MRKIKRKAAEILQKANLKRTAGRIALLTLLLETKAPLSGPEIAEKLSDIDFNQASIYRSLASFQEAGIVHKIESGDRASRFALCACDTKGHCHPHFICNRCGRTECLGNMSMPEINSKKLANYRIEEKEFYLRGLCDRCLAKK
ncbi:MAG: transcriptional repressor [Firmicutes bacterium]|nr:transcriptional repressor [Bacillota bacterium]